MKKRIIAWLFLLVISTLILGCGKKDTIKIAEDSVITGIWNKNEPNTAGRRVEKLIYNNLFEVDSSKNIKPILAESIIYLDNNLNIKLKKGIKFHNNEEMTADDIIFSINYWKNNKRMVYMIDTIQDIKKINDYEINIITKLNDTLLLNYLSSELVILNKKAVEKSEEGKLIGTGPYKIAKYDKDDSTLELLANEKYFGEKLNVKKIIIKSVEDLKDREDGLDSDKYDISLKLRKTENLENNPDISFYNSGANRVEVLAFNSLNPLLKDAKVRKAISYAIDTDRMIGDIFNGEREHATGLIPSAVFGYNIDGKKIGYDVEKAKSLLADAGVKEGQKLKLYIRPLTYYKEMSRYIKRDLDAAGFDVKVIIPTSEEFFQIADRGEFELFLFGWTNTTGEGLYSIVPFLELFGLNNGISPENKINIETLVRGIREENDPKKELAKFEELEEFIKKDDVAYPLFYDLVKVGANKDIKGIKISTTNEYDFSGIYIDEK